MEAFRNIDHKRLNPTTIVSQMWTAENNKYRTWIMRTGVGLGYIWGGG